MSKTKRDAGGLTPREREVLGHVGSDDRGLSASILRDRIYPPDSKMRWFRPNPRGSNRSGAKGGLGNLAAGRLLARLYYRHLVSRDSIGFYKITTRGREALAAKAANSDSNKPDE